MENIYITIAGLIFIYVTYRIFRKTDNTKTNFKITSLSISHESGSTLDINEPLIVTINYKYTRPDEFMYLWVKILDEKYDSMYEGANRYLSPASGQTDRYVYLTEAGEVKNINVVVKNKDYIEFFNKEIKVNYIYTADNADLDDQNDGIGSEITNLQFSINSPSKIKKGTRIDVNVEYDINAKHGLNIWVIPVTKCSMTYEGSTEMQTDKGVILKHFTITEPCSLKAVDLIMKNKSNKTVYKKQVPVDYKYTN